MKRARSRRASKDLALRAWSPAARVPTSATKIPPSPMRYGPHSWIQVCCISLPPSPLTQLGASTPHELAVLVCRTRVLFPLGLLGDDSAGLARSETYAAPGVTCGSALVLDYRGGTTDGAGLGRCQSSSASTQFGGTQPECLLELRRFQRTVHPVERVDQTVVDASGSLDGPESRQRSLFRFPLRGSGVPNLSFTFANLAARGLQPHEC